MIVTITGQIKVLLNCQITSTFFLGQIHDINNSVFSYTICKLLKMYWVPYIVYFTIINLTLPCNFSLVYGTRECHSNCRHLLPLGKWAILFLIMGFTSISFYGLCDIELAQVFRIPWLGSDFIGLFDFCD